MNAEDLSKLFAAPGKLQVKKIVTTVGQTALVHVNTKFSLLKWFKSVGRDEYGEWNFSKDLGCYEIYNGIFIPINSHFYMLELAQTTLDKYVVFATSQDFRSRMKVKIPYEGPVLIYKDITDER